MGVMMESMRGQGGAYKGYFLLISGQQIEKQKQITRIKMTKALDGRRSIFYIQQPTKNTQAW